MPNPIKERYILTPEDLDAESKAVTKFMQDRVDISKLPRFTMRGMNQAEFIHHAYASGFFAALRYMVTKKESSDA